MLAKLFLSTGGLMLVGAPVAGYVGATAAAASQPSAGPRTANGDNNKGDVWLDNVLASCTGSAAGQDAEACESPNDGGPGHEHDPHLACRNIDLWGDAMADSSGQFTIDGWNPSGSGTGDFGKNGYQQDQAWPNTKANPGIIGGNPAAATWSYDGNDNDVIAVIDVQQLIAHAIANGDAPVNKQGFHFKLQFSQDPQKHKTFWVNCAGPNSPSPTPTGGVSPTPTGGVSPTPTGDVSPTPDTSPSATPSGGIGATASPGGGGGQQAASNGQVLAANTVNDAKAPNTGMSSFISTLLYAVGVVFMGLAVLTGTLAKRRQQEG
jgi:hypothetical protein